MSITTKAARMAAATGLTVVVAATVAATVLAPTGAGAAGASRSGFLSLMPRHGSLDDDPVAAYRATTACPENDRTYGLIALADAQGNFIDSLAPGFTPDDKAPSGQLDSGSLSDQVRAHDLEKGYYRVEVLCYNDDLSEVVTADSNWIQIIIKQNRFRVTPRYLPPAPAAAP